VRALVPVGRAAGTKARRPGRSSRGRYRLRETRRAVRRPVRRATLRDPNIVNLLLLRSVTVPLAYRDPAYTAAVSMA